MAGEDREMKQEYFHIKFIFSHRSETNTTATATSKTFVNLTNNVDITYVPVQYSGKYIKIISRFGVYIQKVRIDIIRVARSGLRIL